ncbi:MAG TPA: 30S ribosomal protein S17 [Candidatus Bathyarchaeia archaeon]|nr:30S ribosomal protein S17 [Candidatus Bathyarchaeia archaeon]
MRTNIGFDVVAPTEECKDSNCPFHGTLSVRGQVIDGTVVSDKTARTVVVQREYLKYIPKYERYEKRKSKLHAHNPDCVAAKKGDRVSLAECRPLSKTKSFVVIKVL